MLIVGDTVYRGIQNVPSWGNLPPHQGPLSVPYDVLIACHHGGDYAVGIAGNNFLPGVTSDSYIPIAGTNPVVIYSSNGDGINSKHPHPAVVNDHQTQGWSAGIITNSNFDTYGVIPGNIMQQFENVTIS